MLCDLETLCSKEDTATCGYESKEQPPATDRPHENHSGCRQKQDILVPDYLAHGAVRLLGYDAHAL